MSEKHKQTTAGSRRQFTPEFKQDAVQILLMYDNDAMTQMAGE